MTYQFLGYKVDPDAGVVFGIRGRPVGSKDTCGYLQIDGRTRGLGILSAHQMIWQAVHGPIPPGLDVNHKNGIKTDNRIVNLELLTRSENVRHAYRHGLKSNRGERHPSHRLTESNVRAIRAMHRNGAATKDIATRFGVHRRTVSDVLLGNTWSHVGD